MANALRKGEWGSELEEEQSRMEVEGWWGWKERSEKESKKEDDGNCGCQKQDLMMMSLESSTIENKAIWCSSP